MSKSGSTHGFDILDSAFAQSGLPSVAPVSITANESMPLENKTVMVVDSALATRRALQEQVSNLGAKSVQFASSVTEVEQYLGEKEFALIICEYQLDGDRSGQQLLEEIRLQKRLPWNTAFMMVTAERLYNNVVSVAEFTPDDYLIKPFTASNLSSRIIRVFNKKIRLAKVYEAMEHEDYASVPSLCAVLERQYPNYAYELERLRIESVYRDGLHDEARNLLLEAMEKNQKPWMLLLMGKIQMHNKEFEDAELNFKKIVKDNPEYMSAFDHYADVLWELNKPEQALDTLEQLGAKALGSTKRLRKLADLSIRIGDSLRSKNYLGKVIDRSRNSSLTQMHDYMQLAKIFTSEGRHEEAERLTSKLRNVVKSDELDFARAMMAVQRLTHDGENEKASEKMVSLFATQRALIEKLEADAKTSLLEQCFMLGMEKEGYSLASRITKLNPGKAILDRIRLSISKAKNDKDDEDDTIIG